MISQRKIFAKVIIKLLPTLAVIGTGSCKLPAPQSGSNKLASIDAVVANDRSLRNKLPCGPTNMPGTTTQEVFERVYQAIPRNMAGHFGESTIIRKSANDLQQICHNAVLTDPDFIKLQIPPKDWDDVLSGLKSCWAYQGTGAAKRPVVYILDNAEAINGSLLTMVALAFSQGVADGNTENIDASVATFIERFRIARRRLAQAARVDLENQGRWDVLLSYSTRYKTPVTTLEDSRWFQNLIFSEFFDNHYCTAETNKMFKTKNFLASQAAFQEFEDYFGKPFFAER